MVSFQGSSPGTHCPEAPASAFDGGGDGKWQAARPQSPVISILFFLFRPSMHVQHNVDHRELQESQSGDVRK